MSADEAVAAVAAEGINLDEWRSADNATGFKGVYMRSSQRSVDGRPCTVKSFRAEIWSFGRNVTLGVFGTAEEAALAFARLAPVKAPNRGKPRPSGGTSRDYAGTSTTGGLSSTVKQAAKAFLGGREEAPRHAHAGVEMGSWNYLETSQLQYFNQMVGPS